MLDAEADGLQRRLIRLGILDGDLKLIKAGRHRFQIQLPVDRDAFLVLPGHARCHRQPGAFLPRPV